MLKRLIEKIDSADFLIRGYLKLGECFCPVGHLADLFVQDGLAQWDGDTLIYDGLTYRSFLPKGLIDKAGMTYEEVDGLVGVNDSESVRMQPSKRKQNVLARLQLYEARRASKSCKQQSVDDDQGQKQVTG